MEKIWFWDSLYIIIGCVILSFSITAILKPNNLITGGVTGFSIVMESLTGIDYTFIYYTMSVLILIFTYVIVGKEEVKKIVILSIVFPASLVFFEHLIKGLNNFNFTEGDLFLSSIYYGILAGVGCGLFFKRGFSSGGSDTIAKVIHHKWFPFISISQLVSVIDIFVIGTSVVVFDLRTALYAITHSNCFYEKFGGCSLWFWK